MTFVLVISWIALIFVSYKGAVAALKLADEL